MLRNVTECDLGGAQCISELDPHSAQSDIHLFEVFNRKHLVDQRALVITHKTKCEPPKRAHVCRRVHLL